MELNYSGSTADTKSSKVLRLAQKLGQDFGLGLSPSLLLEALTHRSYSFEHEGAPHSERLEFLGDAVLGSIISHYFFVRFPEANEGRLSGLRSRVVSGSALAAVSRNLGLGEYLYLGRGEENTGGRDKDSLLANLFESLVGAIMLQADYSTTRSVVLKLLADRINQVADSELSSKDAKTRLNQLLLKLDLPPAFYEMSQSGPDHHLSFLAVIRIGDQSFSGEGPTKKSAQLAAANQALEGLHA